MSLLSSGGVQAAAAAGTEDCRHPGGGHVPVPAQLPGTGHRPGSAQGALRAGLYGAAGRPLYPRLYGRISHGFDGHSARGVDLDKVPLGRKIRIYSYILMPAVAGALIQARRVAVAMEARAFRARPRRTWLEWPRLHRRDWLLMAAAVAATAAVLALYWR